MTSIDGFLGSGGTIFNFIDRDRVGETQFAQDHQASPLRLARLKNDSTKAVQYAVIVPARTGSDVTNSAGGQTGAQRVMVMGNIDLDIEQGDVFLHRELRCVVQLVDKSGGRVTATCEVNQ
jgi:hypothetical protein